MLKQCDWLDKRNPSKNRLGMLRKTIEQNWDKPILDQGKGHSNSNKLVQKSSENDIMGIFRSSSYGMAASDLRAILPEAEEVLRFLS